MYDSVSEVDPPDHLKIDLAGKIGKMNVGLKLPFKKTGAFMSPIESAENAKKRSMLKMFPKG